LWYLPVTHELIYTGHRRRDRTRTKSELAAFLLYLVGAAFGAQLQHEDWFVVGRQSKTGNPIFVPEKRTIEQLLDHGEQWFDKSSSAVQTAAISAFYLHNLLPSYEWEWEEFAWEYSVFDACWFIARENGLVTRASIGHADRFKQFADACGLVSKDDHFKTWVNLRNDLIHQVTWGYAVPGHAPKSEVSGALLWMRAFVAFALFACISYPSPSLKEDWQTAALVGLDPAP